MTTDQTGVRTAHRFGFHAALTRLQAFLRGFYVRSGLLRRFQDRETAATLIASRQRGRMVRRRQRAATRIAAWQRSQPPRRELRRHRREKRAGRLIARWLAHQRKYRPYLHHLATLRRWYLAERRLLVDAAFSRDDATRRKRRQRRRKSTTTTGKNRGGQGTDTATVRQRGKVTYADVAKAPRDIHDDATSRWPRGETPAHSEDYDGRRRRRGRPRNSRRHPRHRKGGRDRRDRRSGTPATTSSGGSGTETTADTSDEGTSGADMTGEDPPGKNAAGISRHRRYLKASADDPRYRQHLSRTHPFRDKGTWHQPSRRYRNGRRRRTTVSDKRPVDSVTDAKRNGTPSSCSVVPRPVTLTECVRRATQALDRTIADIAALEEM